MNNNVPVIRIDNVVEYYMLNEKCKWSDEDFPNVAPPFENFILEYRLPENIHVNGKMYKHPLAYSYWIAGYQTKYCEAGSLYYDVLVPEDGWMIFVQADSTVDLKFQAMIFCNKYGILTPAFNFSGKMRSIRLLLPDEHRVTLNESVDFFTTMIHPQLLALSFMHCKNVKKEEVDPNKELPRRVLKYWEKKGKPKLKKYYTLNIEPMKQVLRKEGKIEKYGAKQALHICRGHFKDYSQGKGLFGKYRGLYWWEDCVKGDKRQGEIIKDYSLTV